jgi:sensor histidine kinase regulating citrate/malate metabolism
VFRDGFNYLIRYGDNSTFLRFSLVPLLYYAYLFAVMNLDFSRVEGAGWFLVRILPTIYVFLFYFLLMQSYKDLDEKRNLEAIQSALSQELDAAEKQIALLNENRFKTAAYRHEMRHHLAAIDGFLSAERFDQAREYIKTVQEDVVSITLKRFCAHELVNLLCSSFAARAVEKSVRLEIHARLPKELAISDTELCSLLSNALENALNATAQLPETDRLVELYCEHTMNKLLIEVKNPYTGQIVMRDGLPVTKREGHGHGCRVIQSITELHSGLCSFEASGGQFVLRVVIPLPS